MKNSIWKLLVIILVLITSSSCSPFDPFRIKYFTNNDFTHLKKGMNYEEVVKLYNLHALGLFDNARIYELKFEVNNNQYHCSCLLTPTFRRIRTQKSYGPFGQLNNLSQSSSYSYDEYYKSLFLLVFKDSSLVNFGYLYQFKNHSNENINNMGIAIDSTFKSKFKLDSEDFE